MGKSKIEWTRGDDGALGRTWNPTRGCSRVSEGCRHCYAEGIAARFSTHALQTGEEPGGVFAGFATMTKSGPRWTGKVELLASKLDEPLHWKKPCRVFVNSMSDLFHEALPDEAIDRVFAVMALCPQHTFQVLTKRPERMGNYIDGHQHGRMCRVAEDIPIRGDKPNAPFPLPNVWLGVSVEDQKTADERIPLLLKTPAAVRFVSYEPALGPVDFAKVAGPGSANHLANVFDGNALYIGDIGGIDFAWTRRGMLHWVIAGYESGPGARPADIEWIRSVKDQCVAAGVSFFYKQAAINGRKIPTPELDGQTWTQYPA